ncbi:hypothetical protein ACM66B_005326 [Microbotryomycetes sp. NB124-2]
MDRIHDCVNLALSASSHNKNWPTIMFALNSLLLGDGRGGPLYIVYDPSDSGSQEYLNKCRLALTEYASAFAKFGGGGGSVIHYKSLDDSINDARILFLTLHDKQVGLTLRRIFQQLEKHVARNLPTEVARDGKVTAFLNLALQAKLPKDCRSDKGLGELFQVYSKVLVNMAIAQQFERGALKRSGIALTNPDELCRPRLSTTLLQDASELIPWDSDPWRLKQMQESLVRVDWFFGHFLALCSGTKTLSPFFKHDTPKFKEVNRWYRETHYEILRVVMLEFIPTDKSSTKERVNQFTRLKTSLNDLRSAQDAQLAKVRAS